MMYGPSFAARMTRSPALPTASWAAPISTLHKAREAEQSINFVTCHDGFTLNDLVSYDQKHNYPNGEGNRDGANDNRSWNCGVEGPTDDPEIEALRNRQVKNFLTITLLSLGVPMIVMGDEVRRTQRGNNNAYCQDNETSWFDWTLLEKHADLHRFVRLLIARRLLRDLEPEQQRTTLNELLRNANASLARRKAPAARLEFLVAQPGVQRGPAERNHVVSPDHECLLGAARLRTAAGRHRRPLAPLDRYVPAFAGRHRGLARGARPIAGGSYRAGPRSVVVLYRERASLASTPVGAAALSERRLSAGPILTSRAAPVNPRSPCDPQGPTSILHPSDRSRASFPSPAAPPSAGAPRSRRHAPRWPARAGCQSSLA